MRRKLSLRLTVVMTIDMRRDPSLIESAAFALFGSRSAPLKLPSSSDLSRYTATRNLPSSNPIRAVKTMQDTFIPPPIHKNYHALRLFKRTSKPALFYTVYWEAVHSERTELSLIDQSLAAIKALHLQALIVGRADYPRRTHVIVNVIDPHTHRVDLVTEPYYKLMLWHLSVIHHGLHNYLGHLTIPRKIPTTADSLRLQDHRLLKLPNELIRTLHVDPVHISSSDTFRSLWRTGPSEFPDTKTYEALQAEITDAYNYDLIERIQSAARKPVLRRSEQYKRRTRRAVILGDLLLLLFDRDSLLKDKFHEFLDSRLSNPYDRSLFGLPFLGEEIIFGFRPKLHNREWCARYTDDPTTLPEDLIGRRIHIEPLPPRHPWVSPIVEVVIRSHEKLIVRTAPRKESYPYFFDE